MEIIFSIYLYIMNINGRVNILGNNVKDRFNLYEKVP